MTISICGKMRCGKRFPAFPGTEKQQDILWVETVGDKCKKRDRDDVGVTVLVLCMYVYAFS